MPHSDPPERVLAFMTAALGCPRPVSSAQLRALDPRGRVFAADVEAASGDALGIVVKRFDSARLFEQARRALAQWLGARGELGGARVPVLLAADASLRTIITTRVAGEPGPPALAEVHRAAGRCLAALHRLPIADDDPMPLADALAQRHRAWSRACADALDPGEQQVVRDLAPSAALFDDAQRVPCHRDFTPDNWLWDGRTLALVDFEHARHDLALVDLAKLVADSWATDPALELAFFEGYGRPLSARECTQLRSALMLHGVASLAWGLRHGDPSFVALGRRVLARAGAWSPAGP
ncbi:phosphotransferase enzyme family protein [Enhygromyxa salina]|uniref:Homoserine kinase n=1 Tax=Enhygromyxa salina TaxID=215803 RepID=A0A2S9XN11_9BACT|nr:phosphotransferase [Enhygromyxa salina]PRP94257.1 homoserine kinase [Enhygromyxa salina]